VQTSCAIAILACILLVHFDISPKYDIIAMIRSLDNAEYCYSKYYNVEEED